VGVGDPDALESCVLRSAESVSTLRFYDFGSCPL
jgi:hypothetical protein